MSQIITITVLNKNRRLKLWHDKLPSPRDQPGDNEINSTEDSETAG